MKNEYVFQELWSRFSETWKGLVTTNGDTVKIISSGFANVNHGPDFKNAHIKIGQTEWFGNIELHLRTSDWFRHGHDKDPKYQNIVLHVVWTHDHNSFDISPVLELSRFLCDNFCEADINISNILACNDGIVKDIKKEKIFFENQVTSRYERKIEKILFLIHAKRGNIEQVAWELLSRTFGYKVNADCFEELARSISFDIVRNYIGDRLTLEALLLGQSGLLPSKPKDDYIKSLAECFEYLKWKHGLSSTHCTPVFLRMRPMNFPTIRLVLLASLLSGCEDIFDRLLSCQTLGCLKEIFSINVSSYWLDHFIPDKHSKKVDKKIGGQLMHSIVLNFLIPLQLAIKKRNGLADKGINNLEWLRILKPERSSILRLFKKAGIHPTNGFESQALLELYQNRCLCQECKGCPFNKKGS
jgi:hypothetical protein